MITLCMDTSFHFLTLVLIQDSKVIASIQEEAYRQQITNLVKVLEHGQDDLVEIMHTLKQVLCVKG